MLDSSNLPRRLLSLVKERSPSKTWIKTVGWLSAAVEKLKPAVSPRNFRTRQTNIHLALPGGDNSVPRNQLGENTASGFDTESERANIDEDDISGSFRTRENTTLNGSTVGNSLIGVDTLGRLLATKVLLKELLDLGNTSRSTDEHNLERR